MSKENVKTETFRKPNWTGLRVLAISVVLGSLVACGELPEKQTTN